MSTTTTRAEILTEAANAVTKDRNNEYGEPEDSFKVIAEYWTTWLRSRGVPAHLEPIDVAMMLDLMKTARAAVSPGKRDHYVDKAGYAACAAECVKPRSFAKS